MENIDISKMRKQLLKNFYLMFDETATPKKDKVLYTLNDIKKWVEFGLENDYVNVLKSDEIKNWIKMLKDKTVIIK